MNKKIIHVLLGLLAAIILLIILWSVIMMNKESKQAVPAENAPQSQEVMTTKTQPQNKAASKIVCQIIELESDTCILPSGQKVGLSTGDVVYDNNNYYEFHRAGESTESVRVYKKGDFKCSDIPNISACDVANRVALLKNDQMSKNFYEYISNILSDVDYQKNGGHQY